MNKYILIVCFLITVKNYSQEKYMSYNISYKKDIEKVKNSYKKVMESMANQKVSKDGDTVNVASKKEEFVNMMLMMMPQMLDGISNSKYVSLTI